MEELCVGVMVLLQVGMDMRRRVSVRVLSERASVRVLSEKK
jgi:hypothetical protein